MRYAPNPPAPTTPTITDARTMLSNVYTANPTSPVHASGRTAKRKAAAGVAPLARNASDGSTRTERNSSAYTFAITAA